MRRVLPRSYATLGKITSAVRDLDSGGPRGGVLSRTRAKGALVARVRRGGPCSAAKRVAPGHAEEGGAASRPTRAAALAPTVFAS